MEMCESCLVKLPSQKSYAFIVRIWLEGRDDPALEPVVRGVIEPVEAGERVYFRTVGQLAEFFSSFLEDRGLRMQRGGHFTKWWKLKRGD